MTILWGAACGLAASAVLMGVSALASKSVWDGSREQRRRRIGTVDSRMLALLLACWLGGAIWTSSTPWALSAMAGACAVIGIAASIDPRYTRLWSGPARPITGEPGDVTVEMERDALAAALGGPVAAAGSGAERVAGERDALAGVAGFSTGSELVIPEDVAAHIRADDSVGAVRIVREHSNLGLLEAKKLVDVLTSDLEAVQERRRADPVVGEPHA